MSRQGSRRSLLLVLVLASKTNYIFFTINVYDFYEYESIHVYELYFNVQIEKVIFMVGLLDE